jgi:hypothetical protein
MFGGLLVTPLEKISIMQVSLMTLISSLGSTYSRISLKSSNFFENSKILLRDYLIEKILLSKPIGEESIKNFIHSLGILTSPIMFHAPTLINKMAMPNANITI